MKYTVNKPNTFQKGGKYLAVGAPIELPGGPLTDVFLSSGHVIKPEAKKPKESEK